MLETQISRVASPTKYHDVVIVGAGPYGLSLATHLRAQGVDVGIFGKPLQLWREHMPKGMLLRSYWWATSLSDPGKQYRMEDYLRETAQRSVDPLPAETFINYALWFQKRLVPDVDETYISSIEKIHDSFIVTLVDGRVISCQCVVMAIGLAHYVYRPAKYRQWSEQLVTHTSVHQEFEQFAGKEVVILGGGQGALETAALVRESGAHVHVVTRRPIVWMPGDADFPENRPLMERICYPKAGINPDWLSWSLEHLPYVWQRLPVPLKSRIAFSFYGPMVSKWLRPRLLGKVKLHEGQRVEHVWETDKGIALRLSNQKVLNADHMMLGTGYRIEVSRLSMLHASLIAGIRTYNGAPILNSYFESSVPGLYFVGFSSVPSCGPLYRFVVGTDAAARRVALAVTRSYIRV